MSSGKIIRFGAVTACLALVLCACASKPVLLPKSPVAPPGVDFSGQWLLREGAGTGPAAERAPRMEPSLAGTPRRSRRSRSSRNSSSVHVFLETGKSLKITQTDHGFFVSLDRSVVEEFTFGEDQVVTVGPIEAHRVSGWEGTRYVVETQDKQGAVLREEWHLDESGDVLLRDLTIVENKKVNLSAQQQFDRQ